MERSVDRRTALGLVAGALGWTALPAGTAAAQAGGGAGGSAAEPDYGGWLDGVGNYDGTTADMRGRADVTVSVGVEANGGPYGFGPPAVWVDSGATVRWDWTGSGTHSVVAEDGRFDSGDVVSEPGVNFEYAFEEEGVYPYYCAPHRALGMRGAVAVGSVPTRTPAPTPTPTPDPAPEGEWLAAAPTAAWPSPGFDAANTRHNPATVGPVEDVRKSGTVALRDFTWAPVLAGGRLVVSLGSPDRTVALDAATGGHLWTGPAGVAVTATADAVYLTTEAGDVVCLDATSGEPRWRRRVQVTDWLANDVQVAGGRLLVAGDGGLAALDAATGEVRWNRRLRGTVEGIAAVEGGLLATGTRHYGTDRQDPVLWAAGLDGEGRERWRFERESYPPTRPTVADGTVYVGSGSHAVHAIDAASGRERWTAGLGSRARGLAVLPSGSGVEGAAGTVYVGCNDYHLYALDAATGDRRWRRRTRGFVSPPAVAGGVVYAANTYFVGGVEEDGSAERDEAVHGFDAASGDRLWTVELGEQTRTGQTPSVFGSPVLVADGALFVNTNSTDGTFGIHVLTGATARQRATDSTGDATGGGSTDGAPDSSTSGGGSPGFTAVGTALGLLGAAGLQRLRGSDD